MRKILTVYWNDFHYTCLLAAGITGALCTTLLVVPGVIHWLFHIDSSAAADVMSRRAAMLFLGLSVITFGARTSPPSPLRASVALGVGLAMAGLIVLGLVEYLRGMVGPGISLAILAEVFFASAFLRHARQKTERDVH